LLHVPQFDRLMGWSTSSGASVITDEILIAGPYFSVTNRAHFPIQPIPALVATVL
jgi:hypothetical protein